MCVFIIHSILFYIILYNIIYISIYNFYPKYIINKNIKMNLLDNLVYIHSDISDISINNTITQVDKLILNNTIINFYIHSLGGDFDAGLKLIDFMNDKRKEKIQFHCFAKYAGSTAFTIYQFCDKRYTTYSSTLFQHEIKIKISGTLDSISYWYKNNYTILKNKYVNIKKFISKRIDMDYLEYNKKIKESWVIIGGISIIYNNLADEIVN